MDKSERGEVAPLPELPTLERVMEGKRILSVIEEDDGAGFTWISIELDNGYRVEFPRSASAVIVHPQQQ